MFRIFAIGAMLLVCGTFACTEEVCQQCEIVFESNEEAVRQSLKKVNGGWIYRLEESPFTQIESSSFVTCNVDEMDRTEALDNLVEIRSFESEGATVQYQVKWFANCRLIR